MKNTRLKRLARLLRKDAANPKGIQFDITRWAAPAGTVVAVFDQMPTEPVPVDCGTSACAMGLAVLSGEFKKEGLRANYRHSWSGIAMHPELNGVHDFAAAQLLFNITPAQAAWLFSPTSYPRDKRKGAKGELTVARRIESLVRTGKLPYGLKSQNEVNRYASQHGWA